MIDERDELLGSTPAPGLMPASERVTLFTDSLLVRGTIRTRPEHKGTLRALGLRKINQTVIRPDNAQMRGMVFAIQHLLHVETVETGPEGRAR